jgi:hypothetical protein
MHLLVQFGQKHRMTNFCYVQAVSIASTNIKPCDVAWVAKIQSFYFELQDKAFLESTLQPI